MFPGVGRQKQASRRSSKDVSRPLPLRAIKSLRSGWPCYEVHVAMPLYAMTVSDRQFQEKVESVPPEARPVAYQIQDSYWNRVEQLRARTRGFWEPDDLQELKQLKQERADALNSLAKGGK